MGKISLGFMIVLLAGFGLVKWMQGAETKSVIKRYQPLFETTFNEAHDEEPLCIYEGPFPLEAKRSRTRCKHCENLVVAGLTERELTQTESGVVETYYLTDRGRSVYLEEPDPEYVALVRKRFAAQNRPESELDVDRLAKPRFCFGKERFHNIVEALAPANFNGQTAISVKLVAEAKDVNELLWHPDIKALRLRMPEPPKAGAPALFAPQIVTFMIEPGGKGAWIDSMRYGKWVNEK